jgi:hypothetical protein
LELVRTTFEIRGVAIMRPKELRKRVLQTGPLSAGDIDGLMRRLRSALAPR